MRQSRVGTDVLRARFLSKSYGSRRVLHDVSLTIRCGETMVLTGPSGSGKSTLLHCLAGLIKPDSGEIWFGDRPVHTMSARKRSRLRRHAFGMFLPGARLIPELTVVENTALPLLSGRRSRTASFAHARNWLDRLELASLALARPCELDAGQASLVALARALVTDPVVLFADEPAQGLGPGRSDYLVRVLMSAVSSTGATLIMASRDLQTTEADGHRLQLGAEQPDPLPALV